MVLDDVCFGKTQRNDGVERALVFPTFRGPVTIPDNVIF